MNQAPRLRAAEGELKKFESKLAVLYPRFEELIFRAQKNAKVAKTGAGSGADDALFAGDLDHLRKMVRALKQEVLTLPQQMARLQTGLEAEGLAPDAAATFAAAASRFPQQIGSLLDQAHLLRNKIAGSDLRVQASYVAQELTEMFESVKSMPAIGARVVALNNRQD
jgi:hypothetical protein